MSEVNALLNERLKTDRDQSSKMNKLAEQSSSGELSSFSGVFQLTPITESEKLSLQKILEDYSPEKGSPTSDLEKLIMLTSEVKAITNQAVILHGERIKRAQALLKNYRDGAFSAWLVSTYGNRQTPYNFLQYYELYLTLPQHLKDKLNSVPKQVVYTLSSRAIPQKAKLNFIENYCGEKKNEFLIKIRTAFPLEKGDGRSQNIAKQMILTLKRACALMQDESFEPSLEEKKEIKTLLKKLRA